METFEYKSYLQRRKMQLAELKKYYLDKRRYEYEQGIPLKNFGLRKIIHPLPLAAIILSRMSAGQKLHIIGDKREKTNAPIIYACTHIGGDDIQMAFEAIKKHAYLFLGDPEDLYQRIEGLLLHMNGAVCMETRAQQSFIDELIELKIITPAEIEELRDIIKQDRKIAYQRAIELLKKKNNLLIFPEGAWNLTPNLPVMKLYPGAVKMALETGAEIIPLAVEQQSNNFYVNIGENIKVTDRGAISVQCYNEKLRDALATLKWEIWEYQGTKSRKNCPNEEDFIAEIMGRSDFVYKVEDVYETMYKDKNIATPEEVFGLKKSYR